LLILSETLKAQLLAEARKANPAECCGLLEGFRDRAGGCNEEFIWIIMSTGVIAGAEPVLAAFREPGFDPIAITSP